MSNAPRPSESVKKFMLNLKMEKIFTKNIFTSGQAALEKVCNKGIWKKFLSSWSRERYKLIQGV